jgi:phytoene dehydrogenase-like protein
LPAGGIGAVSKQLADKAAKAGVEIRTDMPVTYIGTTRDASFTIDCAKSKQKFKTSSLIVATDGKVAQKLLATIPGFENLDELPEQPQQSVGCLYYTFKGAAPVEEPILILNGIVDAAGTKDYPVNNVCFPSVVNEGYAPEGYSLCSVTVLKDAMELYEGKPDELDSAVRRQLGTWFRDQRSEIMDDWELKKIYFVSTTSSLVHHSRAFRLSILRSFVFSDSKCSTIAIQGAGPGQREWWTPSKHIPGQKPSRWVICLRRPHGHRYTEWGARVGSCGGSRGRKSSRQGASEN